MAQMMKVIVCCLLLTSAVSAQYCSSTSSPSFSQLSASNTSSLNSFYIAGLFAIHEQGSNPLNCGKTNELGIQNLEAFSWALKNFRLYYQNILTGLDVGGLLFDTCSSSDRAVQQLLNLESCAVNYGTPIVEPGRVLGFVGPSSDEETFHVAPVLGQLQRTLIGFGATHDAFSNSTDYPYYLRTVPTAADEIKAIVSILVEQSWKYVQVLYGNDDYGNTAFKTFKKLAEEKEICVVYNKEISASDSQDTMEKTIEGLLENKETRAVVLLSDKEPINNFFNAAQRFYNLRGTFTWIGTTKWGEDAEVVQSVAEIAEGAITIALDMNNAIPLAYRQHFESLKPDASDANPWLKQYWQEKFQCYLPGEQHRYLQECDLNLQNLRSIAIDPSVAFTIRAVYALLNGIHASWSDVCTGSPSLCSTFINGADKWEIIRTNVHEVRDASELAFADDSGDTTIARYKVLNYRSAHGNCRYHCYAKVGFYEKSEERLQLSEPVFFYNNQGQRLRDPGVPPSTCPDSPCVQCGETSTSTPTTTTTTTTLAPSSAAMTGPKSELRRETWIIALLVLAGLGVLLVLGFEIYLMSKIIGTPFVKHWRTMWLGQLLLLAVLLCYLTLFAFVVTPTVISCAIIRFCVGSTYSMCFAILLVKLMIILSSKNIGYLKGIYQVLMFIFAWGVQLVLDAEWLILDPPGVHKVNTSASGEVWVCDVTFSEHITSLVYVMFLILITTLIAIRTHGIITNHREGIFIGISAGFTIPIWLVWILLGLLNADKDWEDPCMAFGLFCTATLILFVLFLPKVRQLNSMGVEGIYAEDDSPDGYAASIIAPSGVPGSGLAGSVILGPPSYKSKPNGSLVYVNGGLYTEPVTHPKPVNLHYQGDPEALYLRHPGKTFNNNTAPPSVRSAPPVYTTLRRPGSDVIQTNTRVLRMTGDLTGKPNGDRRSQSEFNYNVQYGTTRSAKAPSSRGGTLKNAQSRSLTDLGSL